MSLRNVARMDTCCRRVGTSLARNATTHNFSSKYPFLSTHSRRAALRGNPEQLFVEGETFGLKGLLYLQRRGILVSPITDEGIVSLACTSYYDLSLDVSTLHDRPRFRSSNIRTVFHKPSELFLNYTFMTCHI